MEVKIHDRNGSPVADPTPAGVKQGHHIKWKNNCGYVVTLTPTSTLGWPWDSQDPILVPENEHSDKYQVSETATTTKYTYSASGPTPGKLQETSSGVSVAGDPEIEVSSGPGGNE